MHHKTNSVILFNPNIFIPWDTTLKNNLIIIINTKFREPSTKYIHPSNYIPTQTNLMTIHKKLNNNNYNLTVLLHATK